MSVPPSILLVEDDDQVRSFILSLLGSEGYHVISAGTGLEAVQRGREAGQLDLLLSDMLLPEISGYDVAVELRQVYPGLKIVLMTGYVEGEIVQRCITELDAKFLDKPFQATTLRRMIRESLQPVAG